MKNNRDAWVTENPTMSGWYATTCLWAAQEGYIPGADYWAGKWASNRPVVMRSPERFETEEEAKAWAYAHDIEAE